MRKIVLFLASVATTLALAIGVTLVPSADSAQAAFPGENGKIAYSVGDSCHFQLYEISPNGGIPTQLTFDQTDHGSPAYSADGETIAYFAYEGTSSACYTPAGNAQIYTIPSGGGTPMRLTDGGYNGHFDPAFSPSGETIAYTAVHKPDSSSALWEIFTQPTSGGTPTRITTGASFPIRAAFSPDGTKIAYAEVGDDQIYTVSANGGPPTQIATGTSPSFSPDGQTIAFHSGNDPRTAQIYTVPVDGGTPTQITTDSTTGSYHPTFSPDGTKIAYGCVTDNPDGTLEQNICVMPSTGGPVTKLTALGPYEISGLDWGPASSPADNIAPAITVRSPTTGATYKLRQAVYANYSCADETGGSGLKSCQGTVADGAAIDTRSVGTKTFTVRAEDNDGNVDALTRTYHVTKSGKPPKNR